MQAHNYDAVGVTPISQHTHLSHNGHVVGLLVGSGPRRFRMIALDQRFELLDGSYFARPESAEHAVRRLAGLPQPGQPANEH